MLTRAREVFAQRPTVTLGGSVLAHVLLLVALFWTHAGGQVTPIKRGEPLFVELPDLKEPAPAGNPAARSPEPAAQSAPPAPPARPAPAPAKQIAKAPPPPPAPRARPAPTPKPSAPETPQPSPDHAAADTAKPTETARGETSAPQHPPAPDGAPSERSPSQHQVARATPGAPDMRAALRRGGGAGGLTQGGRGGIEGEPIPLETNDPKYGEYFEHLRRRIKSNWGYPCIKQASGECEYKSAEVVVEFGIGRQGDLKYVDVVKSSGLPVYDDYAVNAIKLSPMFRRVPEGLGYPSGLPIVAIFSYHVETSLRGILR
ncbi:MAG: TonB C-terminal domain-containing protein [Candidatus Rokubacteria bacterium]|nr:TonB C-terminal domain-containing protein [Candidatus Rokubacteria bacterium]MBI3824904.1 TonB C-terminal domain-containing protein [Candidatus Rokubacteria bacterium]